MDESGTSNLNTKFNSNVLMSAGESHTCTYLSDELQCWGLNSKGQTEVPQELKCAYGNRKSRFDYDCVVQ